MRISRRKLIVNAAVISATAGVGSVALGEEGAVLKVELMAPEKLKGLAGRELQRALAEQLMVDFESRKGADAIKVQLHALRVVEGKVVEHFKSLVIGKRPGLAKYPTERHFIPGDMFFPGEMQFPGEMVIPGGMFFPGEMRDVLMKKYALESAEKLRLGEGAAGLYLVVVAADPKVSRRVKSRSRMLKLSGRG